MENFIYNYKWKNPITKEERLIQSNDYQELCRKINQLTQDYENELSEHDYSNIFLTEEEKVDNEVSNYLTLITDFKKINFIPTLNSKILRNYYWSYFHSEPVSPNYPERPKTYDFKYFYNGISFSKKKLFNRKEKLDLFSQDLNSWLNETLKLYHEYKKDKDRWILDSDNNSKIKLLPISLNYYDENIINNFINSVKNGKDIKALISYITLMIGRLKTIYPMTGEIKFNYYPKTGEIIINMFIPNIDTFYYNLEKIYSQKDYMSPENKKAINHLYSSKSYQKKLYINFIFDFVLLCIYHIFQDKTLGFINSIVFNGKRKMINPYTGNNFNPFILSVRVEREDIQNINILRIDSEKWFKRKNGRVIKDLFSSDKVIPIKDINSFESNNSRNYSTLNLDELNWRDFEFLLQELFEKEFNNPNIIIETTKASHDGGVDLIINDQNLITGGKILVQAKKYSKPVQVSAVRDLYGTIQSEGALKGILVTTSRFSRGAYDFSVNKPITLIDRKELVQLLKKNGFKVFE